MAVSNAGDHVSVGPSAVVDQSSARMRLAISVSPANTGFFTGASARAMVVMVSGGGDCIAPGYTSVRRSARTSSERSASIVA